MALADQFYSQMEISYTYMTQADIAQVAALEKQAFSQPWSEDGLQHYLDAGHTIFILAKDGENLAGYAALMCILNEGELVSIAVSEPYQQMGIATELLDILYEEAERIEVARINLEVRKSNVPAIHLYQKEGFEQVGLRKGFYDKPKEDALLFMKTLRPES